MAKVFVKLKIMPESPDSDLNSIETKTTKEITNFGGDVAKVETEEIAFGLKALIFIFMIDEASGSLDKLEETIRGIEEVNSAEVIDVRRAVG